MEKLDAWVEDWLNLYESTGDGKAFKKAIKDKVLESYRNGQRSARRSPKENATSEGK